MLSPLQRYSVLAVALLALLSSFTSASPPKSFLSKAQKQNGIIPLDNASWSKFISQGDQEYRSDHSLIILLTAINTPGVDCGPCQQFQSGYDAVANAWQKKATGWSQGQAGHYFAQVEFKDGKDVFQQLELNYAPAVLFLPRGAPASRAIKYQFERNGFEVDAFSDWAADLMGKPTGYRKPFPWNSVLTFSGAALVTTGGGLYAIAKLTALIDSQGANGGISLWKILGSFLVQALSLGLIVICCAGYMWNIIRGSPFVQVQQNGKIEYFSRQFQHQLAVETLIVAALYSMLAFSVVALILLVPRQRDPTKQRAGVYVWSVIFLAGVSVLFAVFRIKNSSYPFRLFL